MLCLGMREIWNSLMILGGKSGVNEFVGRCGRRCDHIELRLS